MNTNDQSTSPADENADPLTRTSPAPSEAESVESEQPAVSIEPDDTASVAEVPGAPAEDVGQPAAAEEAAVEDSQPDETPVEQAAADETPIEAAATESAPAEEEAAIEDSGPVEEVEEVEPLEEAPIEDVAPLEEAAPEDLESLKMDWYILKVQSNRENSICDGLKRRVAVAGLDDYFGDILVPTEDVAEFKNGKRKVIKRKLYPGYIVVNMAINDDTWFLVRETPGIGDFTGAAGKPTPMLPHEVERIVKSVRPDEEGTEAIKTAIPFKVGDRVRIKEGTFENFEGDVEVIDEANGRVTVMINIFGRSTPVELEHWQVESV